MAFPLSDLQMKAIERVAELAVDELSRRPSYWGCFHDKIREPLTHAVGHVEFVKIYQHDERHWAACESCLWNLRKLVRQHGWEKELKEFFPENKAKAAPDVEGQG